MQTKREYLIGLGLAKEGRGKFSNAAKEALVKAEANGVKFSDVVANVPTPKPTEAPKEATAPKTDPTQTPFLTPDEYRFPEAEYRAVAWLDGKRKFYSLRECCNSCRVSLVNHSCDAPTILGDITVKIERR